MHLHPFPVVEAGDGPEELPHPGVAQEEDAQVAARAAVVAAAVGAKVPPAEGSDGRAAGGRVPRVGLGEIIQTN